MPKKGIVSPANSNAIHLMRSIAGERDFGATSSNATPIPLRNAAAAQIPAVKTMYRLLTMTASGATAAATTRVMETPAMAIAR